MKEPLPSSVADELAQLGIDQLVVEIGVAEEGDGGFRLVADALLYEIARA